MKFLAVTEDLSQGDMYLRIATAGHDVRVFVADETCRDVLGGMLTLSYDWKRDLRWLGDGGILIFETAEQGEVQDDLRRRGHAVIGGSAFGDRLENDRAFGQQCLRDAGLRTASTHEFSSFEAAIGFVKAHRRPYVVKFDGPGAAGSWNYVGQLEDARDMLALLEHHRRKQQQRGVHFVLMDRLEGVEIGVGAYFNGEDFLDAVVMDWEHKRFFPGELGEMTGEMGTLLTYRNSRRLFRQTLARMKEPLRAGGYVGYINLNMIVNPDGLWPLEFTCRFGYPGAAICDALHVEGWETLFARMIARDSLHFETATGFAVGVLLTVPPFPRAQGYAQMSKGLPILFRQPPGERDQRHIHYAEVAQTDEGLVTSGEIGSIVIVTGVGETVEKARTDAYGRICNIVIPKMRYRNDIGTRYLARDRQRLLDWYPELFG